jgi:serine/threonine protein kinase
MPPEMLKQEPYSQKCDVWAFGIACYRILTGVNPFSNKKTTMKGLIAGVTEGEYQVRKAAGLSLYAIDFLTKCLLNEPQYRWSFAELASHDFITKSYESKEFLSIASADITGSFILDVTMDLESKKVLTL